MSPRAIRALATTPTGLSAFVRHLAGISREVPFFLTLTFVGVTHAAVCACLSPPPPPPAATVIENGSVSEMVPSVTVTSKVNVPLVVGVPLTCPAGSRVRPGGTESLADHVYGSMPPVAVNVVGV